MKKYILLIILLIIFIPVLVNAETFDKDIITIESVSIDSKSNYVEEVNETTYEGLSIKFDLKFNEVNDYAKYKIIINNSTNADYEITESSNFDNSEYITYEYSYEDDNKVVQKNSKKTMYITIKYDKKVPEESFVNGSFVMTNNLVINFGNETNEGTGAIKNPITRGNLYIIVLILLITFLLSIILYKVTKKKQFLSLFIISIVLLPISIYAIEKFQIKVESKIEIEKPTICTSFSEDSWETISKNIKRGNTSCYLAGSTKEIEVGDFGTQTVRLVNVSTPDECSTEGFSQTACGFVLEFKDILINKALSNGQSNAGGWAATEVREYINNDVYNMLPEDLKSIIIDTYVVSGYGTNDTENIISTDKLYLFSPGEVFSSNNYANVLNDTSYTNTRLLDYYQTINSRTHYRLYIKKSYGNSSAVWWLRSSTPLSDRNFYTVDNVGDLWGNYCFAIYGVSPAFRIC